MKKAFSEFGQIIDKRDDKPREKGLTMMCDWGEGLRKEKDILEIGSEYLDLAKIAVGISRLIPFELLRKKIHLYKEHNVEPFPGGMFLELALSEEEEEKYFAECKRVGYDLIEVSDNVIDLPLQRKEEIIETAQKKYGLKVLGEVGSKREESGSEEIIEDIAGSLESGAWKSLVEAAEFFFRGSFNEELLNKIISDLSKEEIIFELPGKWIKGVHSHQIHSMAEWLIQELGSNVNIGNVSSDDLIRVETLRTGLGTSMTL